MWMPILMEAARGVYCAMDMATETDHATKATFRQDAEGNLHLLDVEIIEPPRATIETRLVPGSNPPRYEAV